MNYKGGVIGGFMCIYIYIISRNLVFMIYIWSWFEMVFRGNDDFLEMGVFYYRD